MKEINRLILLLPICAIFWAGLSVLAAGTPEITSVEPASVAVNEIPAKLKIKGKNFTNAKLLLNGIAVTASVNSSGKKFTLKQANAPAQLFATDNTINIQVIAADGQASNIAQLKVGTGTPPPPPPPAPTISSISPVACAPGSVFDATIIGSNFNGVTAVRFSNPAITAEILEVSSETQLLARVSVSPTATTGDSAFEVIGSGGVGSSGQIGITIQNSTASALVITNSNTSIKPQETLQLRVQAVDESGYPAPLPEVSWTTDAGEVAGVSSTGSVTGVAPGVASITASASNLQSAIVDVNVFQVESSPSAEPTGEGEIVVDSIGQIYQTDPDAHIVRLQKSFQEAMQLYAGIKNSPGATDGEARSSQFNIPLGIALDENRNTIYIADANNQSIRKIDLKAGVVTTVLTKQDIQIAGVTSFGVRGLAVDKNGSLFISDAVNQMVWFYDASAKQLRPLAGAPGQKGLADGQGTAARFSNPQGVQMDNTGINAIVADTDNNVVRLVTPQGNVTTIGAITNKSTAAEPALWLTAASDEVVSEQQSGPVDPSAIFAEPRAVASDALGNILVVGEGGARLILRRNGELVGVANVLPSEVARRAVACAIIRDQLFILAPSRDSQQLTLFRLSMPNATPRIGKVVPNTIPSGQPTIVTITGANFSRDTLVTINNAPIGTVKVISSTVLTFTVSSNAEGTFPLRVQNRAGVAETAITFSRPSVTVSPTGLNFAVTAGSDTPVNQKITLQSRASRLIVARLLAGGPLTGLQIDVLPNLLPLQPNERKEVTVSVRASRALPGEYEGFLTIGTDDFGAPLQVPLRVAVTKESSDNQISLSPPSINFGRVTVGTTSPVQRFTVKNITTQSITLNQVITTGPFTGPSASKPLTLNPTEAIDFSVSFKPATIGVVSGAVTFTLANGKQLSVKLSGEGVR